MTNCNDKCMFGHNGHGFLKKTKTEASHSESHHNDDIGKVKLHLSRLVSCIVLLLLLKTNVNRLSDGYNRRRWPYETGGVGL